MEAGAPGRGRRASGPEYGQFGGVSRYRCQGLGAGKPVSVTFRPQALARLGDAQARRGWRTRSLTMPQPAGFSWIEKPLLAALARPESAADMEWLRDQGIELLLSLTEDPPRRDWVNQAGLLVFHDPM